MPMTETQMEQALKSLRLSGIRETLETRAIQANSGDVSFMEAFSLLIQDELDRRKSKTIERRFKLSGLKERKTLEDFDWGFNPKIPKKACFELVALKFIKNGESAALIGTPGTGKSHIAMATAHAALQAGYRVIYREAHLLFEQLFEADQLGERKKLIHQFSSCDLLIIDDLFLRKRLPVNAADDLQEIIMNRYSGRRSTFITSNRVLEDWGKCLEDQAVASAILDRLLHYGQPLKFQGQSYRLKESAARIANKTKTG